MAARQSVLAISLQPGPGASALPNARRRPQLSTHAEGIRCCCQWLRSLTCIRALTLFCPQVKELDLTWATLIGMQCTSPQIVAIPHFRQSGACGPLLNHDLWASTNHGFVTTTICLCPQREIFVIVAYEDQAIVPRMYGNHLLSQTVHSKSGVGTSLYLEWTQTPPCDLPSIAWPCLHFQFSGRGLRIG